MIKITQYVLLGISLLVVMSGISCANAISLCGVTLTYSGAIITTNNSPCITPDSIIVNSSGITPTLGSSENRTYDFYPTASITPIVADWNNQTTQYSEWLVTSPNVDTGLKVSGSKIDQVVLNYVNSPGAWLYDGIHNTISVGSGKMVQLFFNGTVPSPLPPPAFATTVYNQTQLVIPWSTVNRNATSFDVFASTGYNNTINSWYRGLSGSNKLTNYLGVGTTPITTKCALSSPSITDITSNSSNIYYRCGLVLWHSDVLSGTSTHDFTTVDHSSTHFYPFISLNAVEMWQWIVGAGTPLEKSTPAGNFSIVATVPTGVDSNQKVGSGANKNLFNSNGTTFATGISDSPCELRDWGVTPKVNTTIDAIACDTSIPARVPHYWNGLNINSTSLYYQNSTLGFLNTIDHYTYKKILTLTGPEIGIKEPFTDFILHGTDGDYLIVVTSAKIYYVKASVVNTLISTTQGRAVQSYLTTIQDTDASFKIPTNPFQSMQVIGPSTNVTISSKFGMFTLISGYTSLQANLTNVIRPIDPQWTNDNTDIPVINTGNQTQFPIILTIANAPINAAVKVTNPNQVVGGLEGVWTISRLDSTHTFEFMIPANQCANIYVADTDNFPYLYFSQGDICATGTTQKTIAYTNTLPITFWTLPWGITDTYTAATQTDQTIVRHTSIPYTYTVVIYNSTGASVSTNTFTTSNPVDTQTFNMTGVAKPAALKVYSAGNLLYSSYMGSSVSLASVASFFHQYFSYQGFDLLSFIPIIFAAMFTRNTVGVGVVMVVVVIATLSWLSIVPLPDTDIFIIAMISVVGLIGYRLYDR